MTHIDWSSLYPKRRARKRDRHSTIAVSVGSGPHKFVLHILIADHHGVPFPPRDDLRLASVCDSCLLFDFSAFRR